VSKHPVVAAALVRDNSILLCHRSPTRRWYPNVWDLPGGHVEAGETPHQALARELSEELGIDAPRFEPEPLLTLADAEFDLIVLICRAWRGEVENAQPEEHDRLGWFTWAELPTLTLAEPRYVEALARLWP
jgi:8-oxo-dGTP diphosphatase